jgi:hypothetical protein
VSEDEDPWPDEPDEPDPEARWKDLEPDGPEIPTPDVDPADVDPALRATFWRAVVLANVALMGLALGVMLVAFRGWWTAGAAAAAVGLFASVRLYQVYREFQRRDDDDTDATSPSSTERNA